ncbi:hypothetical protein Nepgr_032886 [Nepenthes gracilis]|uniref:Patellin-4 n=1 Tax=Nepenthes gracilis TaxID=150966 RepID=A0AAD3TL90_NEPGR|nr:hypothetical protein Nepgr_032886 [Nepenthes gracilis]
MTVDETQKAETVVCERELNKAIEEAVEDNKGEDSRAEERNVECPVPESVEKSSSYREESSFFSDLKESERKALTELKSRIEDAILENNLFNEGKKGNEKSSEKEENSDAKEAGQQQAEAENFEEDSCLWGVPLLPSKGSKGTDVILLKFLRARDFKVNEAFQMLKKTLQWRKKNKLDSIMEEDFGTDLSSAAHLNGKDRAGHPVCYNMFGLFGNKELYQNTFGTEEKHDQFLRWRFQLMEKGIKELDFKPDGVTSILQINDLKNCPGPSKKELRNATFKAIALLQDNYPELVAKNVFVNVPFWYYAFYSLVSPFLTQRSKSKFVVARPAKVTETLLKYISLGEIPTQYGGFKHENDFKFSDQDDGILELEVKAGSALAIQLPAQEVESTLIWDITILGWEVDYKEEFIPMNEGSYAVIISKETNMASDKGPIRNSFTNNEPGKVVLTISNSSSKKKRVFYRYTSQKNNSSS